MKGKKGTIKNKTLSQDQPVKPSRIKWGLRNAGAVLVVMLVLKVILALQPGYNWVYYTLLKENMRFINAFPHLNYDERMSAKLGSNYIYLKNTRDHTPKNAVILWPSREVFTKEGSPFTGEISNKIYALRFLYPRKVVIPYDLGKSRYVKDITHVAIVNGEGFDKVSYEIEKFENGILPIDKPDKK